MQIGMDFLNFVIALHTSLNVDVLEADYPKLATLTGTVDYLATRTACVLRHGGPL